MTAKGYNAFVPYSGMRVDLLTGEVEYEAKPVAIRKSYAAERAETMFTRLMSAGRRLLTVIEHNRGGANKDLARFESQLNSLCDKWDR